MRYRYQSILDTGSSEKSNGNCDLLIVRVGFYNIGFFEKFNRSQIP